MTDGPYADPDKAARRILQIANAIEPAEGKIYIELINYPMLSKDRASPAEYWARVAARDRTRLNVRDVHAGRCCRSIRMTSVGTSCGPAHWRNTECCYPAASAEMTASVLPPCWGRSSFYEVA
jgi:hypothetical protein